MPRGSRPGERRGGRKKGIPNRASISRQAKVAAEGVTPLDVMLRAMREHFEAKRFDEAAAFAKDAAPYVHPKLATTTLQGPNGGPIPTVDLTKASDAQLDALEAIFGPLAAAGDDDAAAEGGEGATTH